MCGPTVCSDEGSLTVCPEGTAGRQSLAHFFTKSAIEEKFASPCRTTGRSEGRGGTVSNSEWSCVCVCPEAKTQRR